MTTEKPTQITNACRTILSRATIIDERSIRIPAPKRHDQQREIKHLMLQMGGTYNSWRGVYEFVKDAADRLDTALVVGFTTRRAYRYETFTTREKVAAMLVEFAQIQPRNRILEPSAGSGALLRFLPDHTMFCECRVDRLNLLKSRYGETHAAGLDFFNVDRNSFDRVVAVPPMSGGVDADHVLKAIDVLRPGGRAVVAVTKQLYYRDDDRGVDVVDRLRRKDIAWELRELNRDAITCVWPPPSAAVMIIDKVKQ